MLDGGRNCEATHAKVAEIGGYDGGTDGAVRGHGVGFDVDGGFHGDRCYSLLTSLNALHFVLTGFRVFVLTGFRVNDR